MLGKTIYWHKCWPNKKKQDIILGEFSLSWRIMQNLEKLWRMWENIEVLKLSQERRNVHVRTKLPYCKDFHRKFISNRNEKRRINLSI